MARAIVVKTVVFDQRLYTGTGAVGRWTRGVTRSMVLNSKKNAPPTRSRAKWPRTSTGALQASIEGTVNRTSTRILNGVVSVGVDYAKYVLAGTASQGRRYIYSTEGWANKAYVDMLARRVSRGGRAGEGNEGLYLKLPRNGIGGNRTFHLRVHGQRANNFLVDGYNDTARRHRALRPMSPRFVYRA